MPLTLNCPKCRKPFRVTDESIGMRVKCPTCAAVLQVPSSLSAAMPRPTPVPAESTATARRPAPQPAKTRKAGRGESYLDDVSEPGPHTGPPSVVGRGPIAPTQPMKQQRPEPAERGGRGAETGPLPSPRKPAPRPKSKAREEEAEPAQIAEDAEGWRKIRKGLFWVQLAYFLALLPAIGNLALIAYAANGPGKGPEKLTDAGILGKAPTLWKEIEYAYLFVIPVLVYLFLFIGRASVLRVPESARTRGTANGLVLLTFISFAAFATYACTIMLPPLADTTLPPEVKPIAWTVFIYFGLLTEAWYLIFLGQAGVPLRSTRTLRDTALSLLMLVVLIAGVLIANDYYPLLVNSPKLKLDEILNTRMIEAGVYLMVAFVFIFRVTAITGIIRRAINRWMEENRETLQAVPE